MCSVITEISCHCIDLFLKTGIVKYTFVHMGRSHWRCDGMTVRF